MDQYALAELIALVLPESLSEVMMASEVMMEIAAFAGDVCTCKTILCKHHYCCQVCGLSIHDGHTPSCSFAFLNAHPLRELEHQADAAVAEAMRTVTIHGRA